MCVCLTTMIGYSLTLHPNENWLMTFQQEERSSGQGEKKRWRFKDPDSWDCPYRRGGVAGLVRLAFEAKRYTGSKLAEKLRQMHLPPVLPDESGDFFHGYFTAICAIFYPGLVVPSVHDCLELCRFGPSSLWPRSDTQSVKEGNYHLKGFPKLLRRALGGVAKDLKKGDLDVPSIPPLGDYQAKVPAINMQSIEKGSAELEFPDFEPDYMLPFADQWSTGIYYHDCPPFFIPGGAADFPTPGDPDYESLSHRRPKLEMSKGESVKRRAALAEKNYDQKRDHSHDLGNAYYVQRQDEYHAERRVAQHGEGHEIVRQSRRNQAEVGKGKPQEAGKGGEAWGSSSSAWSPSWSQGWGSSSWSPSGWHS